MPRSLESARPILVDQSQKRLSTYSTALSSSGSITTNGSTVESRLAEIESGLRRLEDARLSRQRFVPSEKKVEMISKLALAAKLDRALGRRMSGQDAVPRRNTIATAKLQ